MWVTGLFAIGVFAGALGTLGLVLRRRWARPLLLLSLVAVILQFGGWLLMTDAIAGDRPVGVRDAGGDRRRRDPARLGREDRASGAAGCARPTAYISPRARRIAYHFCDVGLMLGERVGEDVAAGAVGDEIERLGRRRVEHRGDRVPARIGDRADRQAGHRIGVVAVVARAAPTAGCGGRAACPW